MVISQRFRQFSFIMVLILLCTSLLRGQDCTDDKTIYVTPEGNGLGSTSSPANLLTALAICKADTTRNLIRLSTGTHNIKETLFIPSGVVIDGNFDATSGVWRKSTESNCILSVSPLGEEIKTLTTGGDEVIVGHYIGIMFDTVENITLKDFTLEVHKRNSFWSDMTYKGDGKSVYGIFARESKKIYLVNLHIVTEDGGEGLYGYMGLDGADARFNQPGQTVWEPRMGSYRPKPSESLKASYRFRAGGNGGAGGHLQDYYRCIGCPGTSATTFCAAEYPLPRGGTGAKGGGLGGESGENCEMDCYYEFYKNKANVAGEFLGLLSLPVTNEPKDPNPHPGADGRDGTGIYNGPDYTDQTEYPYDDFNDYYIPGQGANGGDGFGGGGGGGGGAGGIRTLGMIPEIPGLGDYNLPAKALGVFNGLATLIGGDDVCNAEIVNGSTEGGPGGAGGEGGEGGNGGHGGGASIGVWAAMCIDIIDNNCVFTVGEGGQGGFGGYGGKGGKGGEGLPGRPVSDGGWSYQGAKGGKGGNGGDGSRGQHGSNGRRYITVGVKKAPIPLVMTDASSGCTNSVISLFSSGDGYFLDPFTLSSLRDNLVKDKPSGSSFTAFMKDIKVVATELGKLPVSYQVPELWTRVPSGIDITISRPLPALNVPEVICLGDSLKLSSATTGISYSWKIYNVNEDVIFSSNKKSISFFPETVGNYIVGFQVNDLCCGFSAPQYRHLRVTTVRKPLISKSRYIPYCYGSDSTEFYITSGLATTDKIRWSDGAARQSVYMKRGGAYTVTVTTVDGCSAESDSLVNEVFDLPQGKPAVNDLHGLCTGNEVTLSPDYETGMLFNFYFQSTSKTSGFLVGGERKLFLNVKPVLSKAPLSYFVRKVNTNYVYDFPIYCVSEEVAEIKMYQEILPPVVVTDNVERNLPIDIYRSGTFYTYEHPKALDNCHPYVHVEVRQMPADHFYPLGTTVDTLRYTDISGNFLDYPIAITVHDVIPPIIEPGRPQSYKELSAAAGECGAYYPFTLATAQDNCTPIPLLSGAIPETIKTAGLGYSDVYMISGSQTDSVFSVGSNLIRQTWSDAAGNVTTFEQTILVKDEEKPKLQCSDLTYYLPKDKSTVFTAYNAPLVTDNCSVYLTSTFVSGFGQFGEHPVGTTTERWMSTDASGNIGACEFKLTVLDTIPPTIDCSDIRPSAYAPSGSNEAVVTFPTPPATDNSGTVWVTTNSPGSGAVYTVGEPELPYIATDNSGNSASCSITVVVLDIEAPALTCPTDIKVTNDPGLCGGAVSFTVADAHDNDGTYYTPYQTGGLASGAVFPIGTTQQVFKVTDSNGNRNTCVFNVIVTDNEPPVFTNCPTSVTEFMMPEICGKMITLSVPAATDNSCKLPSTGFESGSTSFFPVGVTHQVYRSRDAYGNSATCAFDVTVLDTTTLRITCPNNNIVQTTPGLCGAVVSIPLPKTNHNYSCIQWERVAPNATGDLFTPGQHTVNFYARVLDQTASCSVTITVNDVVGPKITQPDNIVVSLDNGACGKVVTFADPVVTDNCPNPHLQRTAGLASGSVFPVGTTVQKYLAFDILHSDEITFTVTVLDNTAPVFADVPGIYETTPDICGKVISFTEPVATDNSSCFTITRLSGLNSGDLFPVGTTSQVYVAKDAAGNSDTTRFDIEIVSTPAAEFYNCPPDIVVMSDSDLTQVVWYDIPGRVACKGVTSVLISGKGSGATFPAGYTRETYLITDASGKTDTCSFNVFVAEKVAPYIVDCDQISFDLVDSICGAWVKLPIPRVDDWGGSGLQTIFNNIGRTDTLVFLPVGSSVVEWTAVDKSGNRGYCYNPVLVGKDESPLNPFNSVQVCEGSDVEINPRMSGEGPYSYQWLYYDASTFEMVVVSTDSIFRIPDVQQSHGRQYMYVVTSPCDYTVYQREFLLTVKPSPVVTLTGLDTAYCEYDLGGKPLSYSPAGGLLVGPGIVDGKFYPSKAGIGKHTLSYVYRDEALGCPATASLEVQVYGRPVVAAFIDSAYCVNNPVLQLDDLNSTYAGAGISGTTFTAAIAQVGTHTITRTVTVNGCVNVRAQNVRIQGNVPDASILTTGPVCSNTYRVKLEAATAGGSWSGATVYTDSARNTTYFNVNAVELGEHKIYYKIIDDICMAVDSATIEVVNSDFNLPYTFNAYCYDQGLVSMDVSDNKNYFGYGIENNKFNPAAYDTTTTALFGVSTVNAYGCVDTVWRAMAVLKPELIKPLQLVCKKGDEALLSVNTQLASVTWFDNTTGYSKAVYDTGNYIVQLRNTSGCVKTDTFYVQSKQATLTALINNTHELFKCEESTITLTAKDNYVGYAWSTGASGQSITVSAVGEYGIYVTDDEDCELYDSIVVNNYPPMVNNQIVNNGNYLEAIASTSYAWYRNNGPIEGAHDQILAVSESGDYFVSLLDDNGCISLSDTLKVVLTSAEGETERTFLVYPNPSKGRFTFEFPAAPDNDLDIVFISALGQPVKRMKVERDADQLIYQVSLEGQPAGVYWALVTQKGRTSIVKLVKVE